MAARDFPGPSDHDRQPHQREVTVTTQPTEPDQVVDLEISQQRGTFEALVAMAAMFPNLPGGYIVVRAATTMWSASISLQMESPQAFEQWRVALQVSPADVTLYQHGDGSWLAADAVFGGISIHLTGHHLVLTNEQAAEPRDLSAPVVVPLAQAVTA
jgi:hypothetical protein